MFLIFLILIFVIFYFFFFLFVFSFFFQAEDGIRDHCVTGVQRVLFRSGGGKSGCSLAGSHPGAGRRRQTPIWLPQAPAGSVICLALFSFPDFAEVSFVDLAAGSLVAFSAVSYLGVSASRLGPSFLLCDRKNTC